MGGAELEVREGLAGDLGFRDDDVARLYRAVENVGVQIRLQQPVDVEFRSRPSLRPVRARFFSSGARRLDKPGR